MNALLVSLAIIVAVIIAAMMVLSKIIYSDKFVRMYCLSLFQQRQQKILINFSNDPRIDSSQDSDRALKNMIEILQDNLWNKSKELDESISKQIFNLDLIIDIAYISWLIFFIHKHHDVSKS